MRKLALFLGLCSFTLGTSSAEASAPYPIHILAAENFYGDVAKTIGGIDVSVDSVITDPSGDPHFFNAPANLTTLVNNANILIENGVGYDDWMTVLYKKSNGKATLMNVSLITHTGSGFNPHIWYNPDTMPAFAKALTQRLITLDPAHRGAYQAHLNNFLTQAQLYQIQVQKVKAEVAGLPVTATEPVADALAVALNLDVKNKAFQYITMSQTTLPAHVLEAFENSLTPPNAVRLLIFNDQVIDPVTEQLKSMATQNHIPIVGVDELMPANTHYYAWMYEALFNIRDALVPAAAS